MGTEVDTVMLVAPLDGWCTSLDEAPDPVFAGRMLGHGFAIDPTGSVVHAPCDGEVIALPTSCHAVTLRAVDGSEVLVHVGIDTVGLRGEGFEALVQVGATVRAGDPLLKLDLDSLAQRAKSLLTPVVLLGDGHRIELLAEGTAVRAGQVVARGHRHEAGQTPGRSATGQHAASARERKAIVALAHGLHARPAARIAQLARGADASSAHLVRHGARADARSISALMLLGARHGDELAIRAEGPDAERLLDAIAGILATVEETAPTTGATGRVPSSEQGVVTDQAASGGRVGAAVRAVVASPGLALGPVHWLRAAAFDVPAVGRGAMFEAAALRDALRTVRSRLAQQAQGAERARQELAAAHELLLDDPELIRVAEHEIEQGLSAGHAWRAATAAQVRALERLDDAYLRERAADLRDLENQVLTALGLACTTVEDGSVPQDAIVLANDVLLSQFTALDAARLGGLCTAAGGPTSHVAILAGSIGLPMLVAAGAGIERLPEGTIVLLDAHAGVLHIAPDATMRARAAQSIAGERLRRERERAVARRAGRTADGTRVHVYANLGTPAEATRAVELGAEGCGLLRSEFLFLDRRTAPGEDEQFAVYQETATRLGGRPLTIRTLDVGGDKPLAYLPMPAEDNPALGLRGVRASLYRPELLREQLRAILRVEPAGQCRILLPMITEASEVARVRAELEACSAPMRRAAPAALGAMIETPAAAVLADTLARHVEFFSIGTNDLTQYTLAMDRTHPALASRLDGLHPAVLRLIAHVCEAARVHGRDIAVCGSLAMDDAAIPILLGLGVRELSVATAALPAVKARVASLELEACGVLARQALSVASADEVRSLVAAMPACATHHDSTAVPQP
ncbi:MAG TPA: phosphoenolpyruvate--protein phosphotransferase [Steroidobacteraceae bacterium]|nr:phosphoenolpyruvate--protein phosphotransferase [Steroidobacteraceae bacterium]